MGMCKGCEKVFSALEMKDGYCKECLPKADQEKAEIIKNISNGDIDYDDAMLEAFVAKPEKFLWYKKSFTKFNVNGMPVLRWNWSWWAFFGGWAFLMYRKQYLAAFILFIIEVVTSFMYLGLITMILSGGYATYFIYKGYRVKVAEIENSVDDNNKRVDTMKYVGGYNGWAIGAKIVGLMIQIAAIIIISASIFGMNLDDFDSVNYTYLNDEIDLDSDYNDEDDKTNSYRYDDSSEEDFKNGIYICELDKTHYNQNSEMSMDNLILEISNTKGLNFGGQLYKQNIRISNEYSTRYGLKLLVQGSLKLTHTGYDYTGANFVMKYDCRKPVSYELASFNEEKERERLASIEHEKRIAKENIEYKKYGLTHNFKTGNKYLCAGSYRLGISDKKVIYVGEMQDYNEDYYHTVDSSYTNYKDGWGNGITVDWDNMSIIPEDGNMRYCMKYNW